MSGVRASSFCPRARIICASWRGNMGGTTSRDVERKDLPFLRQPQMRDGMEFYLRTVNGEYVSVCRSCQPADQNLYNRCSAVLCLKRYPTAGSVFRYGQWRDGTFTVRTRSGEYWKRCANCVERCPGVICADGRNPWLAPARFRLVKNDDGSVSLMTDTGRMIEAHACGQRCGRILASLGVGINRQFYVERLRDAEPRIASVPYVPPRSAAPNRARGYEPVSIPFQ